MNLPNNDAKKHEIPEEAEGNPVYEQTRQDMPCWCCGRNCGRNTRIAVITLAIVGIGCSIWACLSANYFSFVQLRNDTFYDEAKFQPDPFRYATEAKVGLFKYEILDVYEYPWPPPRERALFDDMLKDELRRMQETQQAEPQENEEDWEERELQEFNFTSPAPSLSAAPSNSPAPTATAEPTGEPTPAPVFTVSPTTNCSDVEIEPGPGSVVDCDATREPTSTPSSFPTPINPNDIVAEEVDIGVVKKYKDGKSSFDSVFKNAQRGALMGPIFAGLGVVFGLIELCCCTYKCSWLPPALFLYLAFMFQLFTMFLFLSEDFCKYDQDCALGSAGFASVIAVICYMLAQSMVCCSPRPPPFFNCCKKPPVKKKKKKRRNDDDDDDDYYDDDDDDEDADYDDPNYDGQFDSFRDEPNSTRSGFVDPYDDGTEDDYDYGQDGGYPGTSESDLYSQPHDSDTYGDNNTHGGDTYGDNQTYGDDGYGDQSYAGDSYYSGDHDSQYDSQYGSQYDDGSSNNKY